MKDEPIIDTTLRVYFVNKGNFPSMRDAMQNGDDTATHIYGAIQHYVLKSKTGSRCALCDTRTTVDNLVFVVLLLDTETKPTLATCMCEPCSNRADIDQYIHHAIEHWLGNQSHGVSIMRSSELMTVH